MELLDMTLRDATIEHAAHCADCAGRMIEASALFETTQAVSEDVGDRQAPYRVESELLAAFRERRRRKFVWHALEWVGAGIAFAVLLTVLWIPRGRTKVQPSSAPLLEKDFAVQSVESLQAQEPASQPDEISAPFAETKEVNVVTGDAAATRDFVTLPSVEEIGPEDLGMVVRVQLTRESLAQLGYPVSETPQDENLISADVLVGEDGWPRAVKLIR
jgi:hypothetical protein